MTRRTLMLATGGAVVAIAVVGTAIGAGAAELVTGGTRVTPVAAVGQATETPATPATSAPTGVPTATPTAVPTGTPTGTPTSAPAGTAGIGHDRAVEIALAEAGGGRVDEIERETEHGRQVWSVEIVNGDTEVEVDVDAETGEIVKAEREPADDDDKDDRDDDRDDD
ncbi:PepSY domain-containing protein [Solwaraspora sp. WMMD1047]|uniref:PepSY domain-containing protein n=1 Tax=Solwaraspora sp. WMMD1047 TaxID=3016102 RepID=UPI002417C1C5|nr:PepSY domain-containing protein [Solwaraspora sp. WMMD1047]MDG4832090.1 PepSY domain-containing protein [Solwaraspora sp. WMMD1047]